jgi:hypothetical protein
VEVGVGGGKSVTHFHPSKSGQISPSNKYIVKIFIYFSTTFFLCLRVPERSALKHSLRPSLAHGRHSEQSRGSSVVMVSGAVLSNFHNNFSEILNGCAKA